MHAIAEKNMKPVPNTVKMKRLLLRFIKCDTKDTAELRRIQAAAAKVLSLDREEVAGMRRRSVR